MEKNFEKVLLADLGIRLGGTRPRETEPITPVIGLSTKNWTVVDVDCDQGLGAFHRRLAAGDLKGVVAYVLTDKGVLVVYPKSAEAKCDIDGDVRYERVSQQRGYYDMRALSKVTGQPRQMLGVGPRLEQNVAYMITIWNTLASQAARLGDWAQALQTAPMTAFQYTPAEKPEVQVTMSSGIFKEEKKEEDVYDAGR